MKTRVTLLSGLFVIGAVAAGGLLAWAASYGERGTAFGRTERQALHWDQRPQTTTSQEWIDLLPNENQVPGSLTVTNRGPASVSFSGTFAGAPVDIRAVQSGTAMEPGIAHFDPSSGTTSFSFNFVKTEGNRGATCRTYSIQWRSPTAEEATFLSGDVIVNYHPDNTTNDGSRIGCL